MKSPLYSPDIDRVSFSEGGVSAYFNGQKYFDKIESPKAVEHAFRQFEQAGRIPGFSDLLSATLSFFAPAPARPNCVGIHIREKLFWLKREEVEIRQENSSLYIVCQGKYIPLSSNNPTVCAEHLFKVLNAVFDMVATSPELGGRITVNISVAILRAEPTI